jgi:hypothetical protein
MRTPPASFAPSAAVLLTLSLALVACGEDEVDTGDPPVDTAEPEDTASTGTVATRDLLGDETPWTFTQAEFSSDCSIGVYGTQPAMDGVAG